MLVSKNFPDTYCNFFEVLKLTGHAFSNIIPGTAFFNPSSLLKTRPSAGKVEASKNFTLNYVLSISCK